MIVDSFEYEEFDGGIHFSFLDRKHPLWENLDQKFKTVS